MLDKCPSERLCDFESPDICGYENDITANFNWQRRSGESVLQNEVLFDHTYQVDAGHYMFSENFNSQNQDKKARLISPTYRRREGGVCLSWWYNMYSKDGGGDVGIFNVYLRKNSVLESEPLWTLTRTQGNLWRTASITVQSLSEFEVYTKKN